LDNLRAYTHERVIVGRRQYAVYVEGAKLSMEDLHFSQWDGEISFCRAIEIAGFVDLGVDLVKGGMEKYGMNRPQHMPMFQLSHIEPGTPTTWSSRASRSTRTVNNTT
jgi:acetamidase/formamidase